MKRSIGDSVLINPYSRTTGVIHQIIDKEKMSNISFDYIVKLNIPHVSQDTIYTFNYNNKEDYWWQFFNEDELDILEKNYKSVIVSKEDHNNV